MLTAQYNTNNHDLDTTIGAALGWLVDAQEEDGFWAGMLESNVCMEAEWLLAFHVLGVEVEGCERLLAGILARQRDDGAWETYHDAPNGDINTTVESYLALRAYGMSPECEEMTKAREWIFAHGGLRNVRVFTRYWMALLGEWPWHKTPNLPPEIVHLPRWVPFNIYNFASWARATLLPLSVLSALRFTRPLAADRRPHELFPEGREHFDFSLPRRGRLWSWESLFRVTDRVLHGLQALKLTPGRRGSIARCSEWIVRHQDADGAWGGIQPPWVYSLMALHAAGYPATHPVIAKGLGALDAHWSWERDGYRFIQASESPVWDTLLSLLAIQECDAVSEVGAAVESAVDWVLDRECRFRGDWSVHTPHAEPGGWAFERANQHYPDIDDTAVALLVLSQFREGALAQKVAAPVRRAVDWTLAMQSDNGGWGAFDRNNDTRIITKIPFCDFGEVLDPPSVDVTAHVVEGLLAAGIAPEHEAIRRAVAYLWDEQEPVGCWFGRWGVNYIYGTAAALPALAAAGEDLGGARIDATVDWLHEHQNDDGGWGETCASYMDLTLAGTGTSTASQTAWAIIALIAANRRASRTAVSRGVSFLLESQQHGTWDEPQYTGTGFPGYGFGERLEANATNLCERFGQGPELARAFMINYNLYRHYFPLLALGRARRWLDELRRLAA